MKGDFEINFIKKISPNPSLPKRGNASLWKREVRRDLGECRDNYETFNRMYLIDF